ncbi:RB1-inducible coiled-coil protein 1 isoform X2 [Nasonia vitripennis]|uniref:RB1-inducible coiled-coil protein 1 n=1 Tax=Nasonia vitripennis TaxID=7425 RepID=A0A7M7T9Q2_NASVI|nr:RB1-inducible coiled-coil protein 1 isoform X2 [Nasonia vitripennis]
MLYIFHVDTGTTITFDIKLALQNVSELKEAIERECGVATTQQVLLMSGGESLESHVRVCTYSAGTDTNPIYLFSKAAIESQIPPVPSIDYGSDIDLQTQIDASLALPATYQTLVARAQLAQQCCALARDQTRICERLVHDQHLQQQGWAAVVANLEDITQTFQNRAEILQQNFAIYLTERQQHMDLLANFNADLQTLEKIPILPALRAQAEGLLSPDEQQSEQQQPQQQAQQQPEATSTAAIVEAVAVAATAAQETSSKAADVLSLLKWISAKDNQSSLEQVADQCSRGLEQFDERVMEALKNEVSSAIEAANMQDMKEIKGLGERLFALEQLMAQTKKLVHDQSELAQGFQQNKTRVSNLNDDSVLPDLCDSHRRQLVVMLQNHTQLRDIRRRCTKAKEELSVNIHRRLKWIMYVENKMMEVDGKLVMYHESLRRLRRQLEILRQIHLAPQMYVSAISEVVRRRTFSQAFLMWASNLACQLLSVHSEEIERRREFQNKFDGHFLNTLFPGLEDTPPPYATQAPSVFDNGLPKLTAEDMESLRQQLPDLASSVSTPDLSSITQFFFSKSLTESGSDGNKEKESTSMRVDSPPKEQEGARPPLISDRGGFESETDTEEFEKIGQAAMDSKLTSYESTKQPHDQKCQKQLEVGASISTSSISTNISPLNRSISSSSSEMLHFPSLSISEKQQQPLSPLTECVENTDTTPSPKSSSNFPNISTASSCDGQQKKLRRRSGSDGSSPSVGNAAMANDFLGTEFYMDESLPSSLSEHPTDSQHQAIVSLLQESLGSTREEVERLRAFINNMKAVATDSLLTLRRELTALKEQALVDRAGSTKILEKIGEAVKLHTCALREREQELTVDHELELSDLKKMLQARDEEVQSLNTSLMEKEIELAEQHRLVVTMRQKSEAEQQEMKKLQSMYRQLKETLEQTQIDKENAVKETNEARVLEAGSLRGSLEQCQERVHELEEKLAAAELEHQKTIKEETEKLQLDYKTQLDTIRSRFKLMTASAMERSPSDSSLEKIERVDVIELVNHETILAQTKKDLECKKDEAIREAIERERKSLTRDLQIANDIISKNERELEVYRQRETTLLEECRHYKATLQRLDEAESLIHSLETDKATLEHKISADQEKLEQQDDLVLRLERERDELRQELDNERLKMSQTELEESLKTVDKPEKDEVRVSESKKVRLEADSDLVSFPGRLDVLEADNKKLTSELRAIKENKERTEAKVEALENERVRLEVELGKAVRERSKRNLSAESLSLSSISVSDSTRDKDMNASVSVVSESSMTSRVDVATSTERSRREVSSSSHAIRDKLTKSTNSLVQQGKINFTTCNTGDVVLVLWDQTHRNYTLLQDSPTFYFLNSDCISDLDLKLGSDGLPTKLHAVAEVVEKEYCSARKPENRYRVPQGTKFYRVRVKPLQRHAAASKSQ